jgi:putative hemolysin
MAITPPWEFRQAGQIEAEMQATTNQETRRKLIDLQRLGRTAFEQKVLAYLERPLARLLSIDTLNNTYAQILADPASRANFFNSSLAALGVAVNLAPQDLRNIPLEGPTVVMANHPLGGLDGVVLASVLTALRPDVKIMGNYLLGNIPMMEDWLIAVDPFGQKQSARENVAPLLKAISWVKNGGMLVVFPGREVSHFQVRELAISDADWSPSIGAIVRHARATVLPVYFDQTNSWTFQLLGSMHSLMRTLLLPRELISKRASAIEIRIGKRIPWSRLNTLRNDEELINHVRRSTYIMANRKPLGFLSGPSLIAARELPVVREQIISAVPASLLQYEVASLPVPQKLSESGEYSCYYATTEQAPAVMREIGRLREVTFRDADEGTGRALDLDDFDNHYTHLFLWHKGENELVGAYRLGLVPDILKRFGSNGLYTSLLFKYEPALWSRWDRAIELGRAFIQTKYQKRFEPLSMLWRGICRFIVRHPEFTTLFGPLSISRAYNQASKSLIELYIRERMFDNDLSRLVKARNPFRPLHIAGVRAKSLEGSIRDLEDLSMLVSSIESDAKGIPVLFRQYAKFDFRVLAFNVNRYFSSTVDGLMYVDLLKVKPKELRRYMGEEGYETYAAAHPGVASGMLPK